ncbi:MAG TPA: PilT/PilU family type 4a pilus ATPase [Phycisphaerae bacterium]|nr:PilT/PilU family type 4a pilus ATPase [Phycisphaerae bacterium]
MSETMPVDHSAAAHTPADIPAPAPSDPNEGPTPGLGERRKKNRIDKFFKSVVVNDGSDLHLKSEVVPRIRVHGDLVYMKTDPIDPADMDSMIEEMLNPEQLHHFREHGTLDLAYAINKVDRFRVNIFRQRGTTSLVARRINPKIPNYKDLGIPEIFSKVAEVEQGLVILAGITGSGKSTTIAAMLGQINDSKAVHIVTLEDPIEFSYLDNKSIINQREIGLDVDSWEAGIRAMMREDPDVILIGEMRDRNTFQAAITAAETGHLVFSTIHASSAPGTITRILELFPKEQHDNIRQALAANIVCVAFQKLVPGIKRKRVPVVEVMLNSPSVRKYILEEREAELASIIRKEKGTGSIDFNEMLAEYVLSEQITSKEALLASPNPDELRMRMKGISAH